jgi:Rhodopirellula transposase DDE domain
MGQTKFVRPSLRALSGELGQRDDPTGSSKWNPVEHRLFGPVSVNRSGQPLRGLETTLGWVRGTELGGVGVTASLDRAS